MQNSVPITTQSGMGLRAALFVFGEDDPTFDGTCDRDYIHVIDLVKSQVITSQRLVDKKN